MRSSAVRLGRRFRKILSCSGLALCLFLISSSAIHAATLCVNPKTPASCYTTINSAVAAAKSGDTVLVSSAVYKEDVIINKSISLLGNMADNPVIDATGLANGIYIDGYDNPGLSEVTVARFNVQNAKFEGILAQNVSQVSILRNTVYKNDQGLDVSAATCVGIPAFETSEASDCGEGIHLIGVANSIVAENFVYENSGGILISDETALNFRNVITHNTVHDNPYACGITLASHPGYAKTGTAPLAFGVEYNTVSENLSYHNGEGLPGAGAGIGLYAPGPGNVTIFNTVADNTVTNNGLSGIAMHNHVYLTFPNHPPNPVLNYNVITGNNISNNAADIDLGLTAPTGISILGTTPIVGTVISGNTITDESIDFAINNAGAVDFHYNSLEGGGTGVDALNSAGTVNASGNWWGCTGGPGASGCSSTSAAAGATVTATSWLDAPIAY